MLGALNPVWLVVKPFWKPLAIVIAVAGAWWAFTTWRDNLVTAAENRGFGRAEQQYKAAVDAANRITEHDNTQMTLFATALGALGQQRAQAIDLHVQPQIDRIQNEVANDPRYRDCRVSDGVLGAANAARASVDADVRASNPAPDRP